MEIYKAVNKHLLGTHCTEVDPKHKKSKILKYRFKRIYFPSYIALFFSSYSPDKLAGLTHNNNAVFPTYPLLHCCFSCFGLPIHLLFIQ